MGNSGLQGELHATRKAPAVSAATGRARCADDRSRFGFGIRGKAAALGALLSLAAAFSVAIPSAGSSVADLVSFGVVAADAEQPGKAELLPVPQRHHREKPSFALHDLAGARHDLLNVSGRLVLVHFFATWCEPCREELPALQRLIDRSGDSSVAIFAISVGEPDDRVRRFFERNPVRLTVVLDRDREVARTWRVQSLPTTYVLDGALEPRLMVEGEYEWDRVKAEQLFEDLRFSRQDEATRDGG